MVHLNCNVLISIELQAALGFDDVGAIEEVVAVGSPQAGEAL
jgi:hypothetical protein